MSETAARNVMRATSYTTVSRLSLLPAWLRNTGKELWKN